MLRRGITFVIIVALLAGCSHDSGITVGTSTAPTTAAPAPEPAPVATTTAPSETAGEAPDGQPPPEQPPDAGSVPIDPDGVGDVLFPELGNPGIDVQHYGIQLDVDPDTGGIDGTVTMVIEFTESRTEFTLDATGLEIDAVTIDGGATDFAAEPRELRITPAVAFAKGDEHSVAVTYHAVPDSGTSEVGLPNGWFVTEGGSYVLNEPDGARSWMPCNDHPSDKATYTFEITVPSGLTAVANGDLVDQTSSEGLTTYTWAESRPMATYLIQLLTGDYSIVEGVGPNGLPLLSVVLTADEERMQVYLDGIAEQIDFFDDLFGPYPLDRYGVAMTDSSGGLAMETLGRSLFSREDFLSGENGYIEQLLLSHELGHQWFGDAVTLARWQDIWLNESFATYAQWLWLDHMGLDTLDDQASQALIGRRGERAAPPGDPEVGDLFGFNSYDGGATVLHALRRTIGDDRFFDLLRAWVERFDGRSASTHDFIALAEEIAGQDLSEFFDTWLYGPGDLVPPRYPARSASAMVSGR